MVCCIYIADMKSIKKKTQTSEIIPDLKVAKFEASMPVKRSFLMVQSLQVAKS